MRQKGEQMMKKLQRIIALLLCIAMIVPSQGMPVYATTADIVNEGAADEAEIDDAEEVENDAADEVEDTDPSEVLDEDDERISEELPLETLEKEDDDRISETVPLESIEDEEEEWISETVPLESIEDEDGEWISETLPLEIIEDDRINEAFTLEALDDEFPFEETVIYWNPGGAIPQAPDYEKESKDEGENSATASNARSADGSGRSSRDITGLTPYKPVKTLKDALNRAKQMQEEGIDPGEITIYMMNPMEIKDGQLYILNAGNIRLVSWPGRTYKNDSLFYVNGGQLTLVNATLESGIEGETEEDAELIYMRGGILQMGQNVTVNGRIVMDYRSKVEALDWQEEESQDSNNMIETNQPSEAETSEVETLEVETPEVETPEAETPEAETPEVETREVETSEQEAAEPAEAAEAESSEQEVPEIEETETSKQEVIETAVDETMEEIADITGENTDPVIVTTETTSGELFTARIRKTDLKRIEFFNIDNYTFDTEEDNLQMIRDTKTASTWREPIIELLEGFGTNNESYLLEVRGDEETSQLELVKTLYADGHSEEEFVDLFTLVETPEISWDLTAYSEIAASVRDTDFKVSTFDLVDEDLIAAAEDTDEDANNGPGAIMAIPGAVMTQKTLIATRNTVGETIYWNPGLGGETAGNVKYNAGIDPWDGGGNDGSSELAPVKTWGKAVELAKGGTIIVMNSVNLSDDEATDYIPKNDGIFLISSQSGVTVKPWPSAIKPAFIVEKNQTLVLNNVVLAGYVSDGVEIESVMVESDKGNIIIEENVTAESGYIYVKAYDEIEGTPIKVTSTGPTDGNIKLFFAGINENLFYHLKDVVVPWGDLKISIETGDKTAEDVGKDLLDRMVLHSSNSITGGARFNWSLHNDTDTPQNLELYVEYYYNAIYLDGGERGNDDNLGASCEYPVKTWARAREIWEKQMDISILARKAAKEEGKKPEDIEKYFPLPNVIYICGTVTVKDTELWELKKLKDYDETTIITTEVRAHTDIPKKNGSEDLVHDIPKTLIKVVAGAKLTIKDVLIRYTTNEKDSNTIQVEGGELVFIGATTLTGGLPELTTNTYGKHVVISDGIFNMGTETDQWTGSIMLRQHGVTASGTGTEITLNSGNIEKNNSYDKELNTVSNQLKGAGIIITNGATFTMNGGEIKENAVYNYGAGVYLDGEETTFRMNKGKISGNKMALPYASLVTVSGIGVYGGPGTNIYIGKGDIENAPEISGNKGYFENESLGSIVSGGGIYSDGLLLKIDGAIVRDNITGSPIRSTNKGIHKGIGIYVGKNTKFQMDGSVVTNNLSSDTYGTTYGAGICIESSKDNYIKNSKISGNRAGGSENDSETNSSGGGIYVTGTGTLIIDDTKIFDNQAVFGGGINYNGSKTLNISNTHIYSNTAQGVSYGEVHGNGGGIYVSKGTVTLEPETIIGAKIGATSVSEEEGNWSKESGGGIYQAGGILYLKGSEETAIIVNYNSSDNYAGGGICSRGKLDIDYAEITNNKTLKGSGGGIYSGGTLTVKNSVVKNNEAKGGGGGIYSSNTANVYKTKLEYNITAGNGGGYYGSSNIGYFNSVTINNNIAQNGGGVYIYKNTYLDYYTTYLTDCLIEANDALDKGGGVYIGGSYGTVGHVGKIFFTETKEGKSRISENTAAYGGGIYTEEGVAYIDIKKPFNNKATTQGSNLYLSCTGNWILQGAFEQPAVAEKGIYNVYVDVKYGTGDSLYLDPAKVTIDKKKDSTSDPDVIYLNTASSFLTYLSKTPSNVFGTFPIDVNEEDFKVGSVVIKPAKLTQSIDFYKTKDDGSGLADSYFETWDILEDASDNLYYSSGGKLPGYTSLGGYKGNVVLVGEGVYLDGSSGKDSNGGTSPDDAVATFKKAKTLLSENIKKAANDSKDQDGFSPFIYISGNVKVSSKEEWELDYLAKEFASEGQGAANWKYAEAVTDAEYAQIKRFASFIDKPLITVKDNADFETGSIIINGMMEAVIITEQSDNSPLIKIESGSTVTLTGNSRLTNNYYSGVDVAGTLKLTGEKLDKNYQLLNIDGHYVNVLESGTLEMEGYSRIIEKGPIERRSNVKGFYGVKAYKANVQLKDNSAIVRDIEEVDKDLQTMMQIGIYAEGKTDVKMQNDSSIINFIKAIEINSGNVEMDGNSKISFTEYYKGRCYGIWSMGESTSIVMKGKSKIEDTDRGIYVEYGKADIQMQGESKIINSYYGIDYGSGEISLKMNMDEDAGKDDSAKIIAKYGVDAGTSKISLGKKAEIINSGNDNASGYGIWYNSSYNEATLCMEGESKITGFKSAVFLYSNNSPIHIKMQDFAVIENNRNGIAEDTSTRNGVSKLSIEMSGYSKISENTEYGISLMGLLPLYDNPVSYYHKIKLEGNAEISTNGYTGIIANSALQLEMSGNSKIVGNGASNKAGDDASKDTTNGIYLTRDSTESSNPDYIYYRYGTSKISLSDKASVENNKGGIYVADLKKIKYPNPCEITLEGNATIVKNTDAVYLMGTDQKIELKDSSSLGEATVNNGISLDNYGSLTLDGKSNIESRVYLRTSTNPITMTGEVNDVAREYHLWLAEGFMGKTVVQPNDPEDKSGGMKDVTGQFDYFKLDGADGLAELKKLAKSSPNIILQGDNNVYLAGDGKGNDLNDGNSPATAVRTFKRAKELLETGYYTEGANILICSEVQVLKEDSDWSFDSEGKVKNAKSGERWTPKVMRYKDFTGTLINVSKNSYNEARAAEVTFKNIIIDGASEEIFLNEEVVGSYGALLSIINGNTVHLKEDAVLQNNKVVAKSMPSTVGISINGGTLEIDGGIIRNMEMKSTNTNEYAGGYHGSAIYCSGSPSSPSKVIMKSGQIANNNISFVNAGNGSYYFGAIYLHDYNSNISSDISSEMIMSGGVIENNKNILINGTEGKSSNLRTGAILNGGNFHLDGGTIRGNSAYSGSAISYYGNGSLIISGGQIENNTTTTNPLTNQPWQPQGSRSPIYIGGSDFQLKGGGADIKDNIYLTSTNNIVKVSGKIYQTGRAYNLYLKEGYDKSNFKKGSTVVRPDGNYVIDVTPYLNIFRVHSNQYILDMGRTSNSVGAVPAVEEKNCLVLMKAVYLDSVNGEDFETINPNGAEGLTPAKAVATFTRAKKVGEYGAGSINYYIIYISGKAVNTSEEPIWSLPEPAYMCRYTGFPIYDDDGNETPEIQKAYHGYLIEPAHNLEMKDLTVYGRRITDTIAKSGESILKVNPTIEVNVGENVALERNHNDGVYMGTGGATNLSSKGGAVFVDAGGTFRMKAGSIQETEAAYGSAIYLEASETDSNVYGKFYLTGSPVIAGKVYLSGTATATAAYIEPDSNYKPAQALNIAVGNDYNSRPVISYTDGTIPGYDELQKYAFEDSIHGLYYIANRAGQSTMLELSIRKPIYLDGKEGNDNNDGLSPETAYKTLKKVYQSIGKDPKNNGILVLVVDTVEISKKPEEPEEIELMNILVKDSDGTSHYEGYYKDSLNNTIDIRGQVYFRRYAQPSGYDKEDTVYNGFAKKTLLDTLFHVKDGGIFSISGMYIDGHSQETFGSDVTLEAMGVEANSPLITVEDTGILKATFADGNKAGITTGVPTATIITHNTNVNKENGKFIGTLDGRLTYEGRGAGIELLAKKTDTGSADNEIYGTAYLESVEFRNLKLGKPEKSVAGGTDVYSNGDLHFSLGTLFSGTVFLEGIGNVEKETSRYMTADVFGEPTKDKFQILMRDPYEGRTVIAYKKDAIPTQKMASDYLLEENVKDLFYLTNRVGEENILELHVPRAVYVNGSTGSDYKEDRIAGSTPKDAVKTLKRAYELLKTRGGDTIYVVDTIQISSTAIVTGSSYKGVGSNGEDLVELVSTDKVKIVRYIQPDFAKYDAQQAADTGYDVGSFTGVLLNVTKDGSALFSKNIIFDGHSEPKKGHLETTVNESSEAKAPMITVEPSGILELEGIVTLKDNNNTYQADTAKDTELYEGGAINNRGTVVTDGALFTNNYAEKGSAVYQSGEFTILSAPEKLKQEKNTFYLTTEVKGTEDNPVWGTDHVIQVGALIPDYTVFDVDMDHAVKGRDVVRFTDNTAFDLNADAEHDHFKMGPNVHKDLFLVEDIMDPFVLELQDWEILDVEVPQDIYLVVRKGKSDKASTILSAIRTEAPGTDLFSTPEYMIKNKGNHDVKVFVDSFANKNTEAEIKHDHMNLVDAPASVLNANDMYLAIKGLDVDTGFVFPETPLKPYADDTVTEEPVLLGGLKSGADGKFTFVGAFGSDFVNKYMDNGFPIEGGGSFREKAQQYLDGTSDDKIVNARAKYEMKYRIEIDPSRREPTK